MQMAFLELVNLTKKFRSVVAVDSVSLQMQQGEFLTLLGPSGCGKTTTLRMIAGFEKPTSGDIYIKGECVNEKAPFHRNAGMVFQNYALFPHMSVYENVAYGLRTRNFDEQSIRQRVKEALDLVRLKGLEERYPKQLSGGQQQRVALARVLVIEPDILLLDEPLSNLDLKLRQQMRLEIKTIQKKLGITSLYVTHDQGEALIMSDRLVVMNKGKVVQVGTPIEVYERPKTKFVADFIGEANLITGTVLKSDERGLEISIGDGQIVFSPPNKRIKEKEKVELCIRPERIQLSKSGRGERNSLKGKIEQTVYIGSQARYHISLGKLKMIVSKEIDRPDCLHQVADEVFVEWSEANTILLSARDEDDERQI